MSLFGGKNSMWNKPLGTGKNSVNKKVESAVGKKNKRLLDMPFEIGTGNLRTAVQAPKQILGAVGLGGGEEAPAFSGISSGDVKGFLQEGRKSGEALTGADAGTIGKERADIRQQYKDILGGNSIVEKEMKQDRNTRMRQLKASQAQQGGGQMSFGQQQALQREAASQIAEAKSKEYLGTLNKLERQFRGAAGDIARLEGQYGSIGIGGQPIPQPAQSQGLLSWLGL